MERMGGASLAKAGRAVRAPMKRRLVIRAQAYRDFQEKSKVEYDDDRTLRLALAHLIQIIGEAARRVSPECRETRPEIPWKAVMGMRHKVVHNYFEVDEELVWKTVVEDLPALISELERFLKSAQTSGE